MLLTDEDEVDVLETLLVSAPLPVDVLLSLFCVPGKAGKSSLLMVNSVVSDAGVLMIPTLNSKLSNVYIMLSIYLLIMISDLP